MARAKYFLFLFIACSFAAASAQTIATVKVATSPSSTPAITLYSGFSGLSFEKSGINKIQGTTWGDSAVESVFSSLGHGVMRIGGNSTDQALWAGSYTSAQLCPTGGTYTCSYSAGVCTTVTGPDIPEGGETGGPGCAYVTTQYALNALNAFLNATGWKVIWSLNMCLNANTNNKCASTRYNDPDQGPAGTQGTIDWYANIAAQEAIAVATTLGSNLVGFEIGNEPGNWATNGVRWNGPSAAYTGTQCTSSAPSINLFTTELSNNPPVASPLSSYTVKNAGCGCPANTTLPMTISGGGGTGGIVSCQTNGSGNITSSSCTISDHGWGYWPSYNFTTADGGQGVQSNPFGTQYFTEFNLFVTALQNAFANNSPVLSPPNIIGPVDEKAYFDSDTTPNYFDTTGNTGIAATIPASESSMITDHLYPGGNQTSEDSIQLGSGSGELNQVGWSINYILNPINGNINGLSTTIPFRTGEASTFSGENYSGIELMTPVVQGANYQVGDTITVPANSPPACYTGTAYSAAQATVTSVAPSTGAVTGLQVIANENGWGFNTGYPGRNTHFPGTGVATTGGHGNGDLTVNYTTGNAGNEYGTALWGLDFEFAHAQAMASNDKNYAQGVNYHDVWAPVPTDTTGLGTLGDGVAGDPPVRPLYYSMFFFNLGLGGLYQTTLTNGSPAPNNFTSYAATTTVGSNNYYHVYLINKDFSNSVATTVNFQQTVTSAWSMTMTQTSNLINAIDGVTIGGNSINSSGAWTPCTPVGNGCGSVALTLSSGSGGTNNETVVTVPPGSAMLITAKIPN